MKLTNDFFNKTTKVLRDKYFPTIKFYRDDDNCAKVHYAVECFNNGVSTYSTLINKVAKCCKANKADIHKIVSQFVEDFEGYVWK